jgi:hypothetical protein
MTIYYLVLALIIGARMLAGNSRGLNTAAFYLIAMLLVLWVGFRFEVGCDWYSYESYGDIQYESYAEALEQRDPLFHLTIRLLDQLALPFYPSINVVAAVIFFAGVAFLAGQIRDKTSFLLYLFTVAIVGTAMSGIRQAMAMGILMIALAFLIRGRMLGFVLFVLIASGFHGSAFVFLILWPIMSRLRGLARISLLVIISVPAALVFMESSTVDVALDRYTESDVEAFGSLFRLGMLVASSAFFFAFVQAPWRTELPESYALVRFSMISNLVLFGLTAVGLPGVSSVIFDRLGLYFVIPSAFMQAVAPTIMAKSRRNTVIFGLYLATLAFFFGWSSLSRKFGSCYLPYSNYLLSWI